MHLLTNPVRDYAWGSRGHLAAFLDRPASGGPEAELWIGAHESGPSLLADGTPLDQAIADDPDGMLGAEVVETYGARLPFLMKVLAVGEPLSLQVHPTAAQARRGFDLEERAGVPRDAPERRYRDPWHKPELLLALSRFEGMAGLRDVAATCHILRLLDTEWSRRLAERLSVEPPQQSLRTVVAELLACSADEVRPLLVELVAAAGRAADRGHRRERSATAAGRQRRPDDASDRLAREAVRVFDQLPLLALRYPDDPGVLVTLLLNHVVLAPGEAMFVDAGVIHAYVAGLGVEVMAASDNVLRAGLTPKHRDVDELLVVANFSPTPPPRLDPTHLGDAQLFGPPGVDFLLAAGPVESTPVPPSGPRLVLVTRGTVAVRDDRSVLDLGSGASVFLAHDSGPVTLSGSGMIAVASVGRA